MLYLLVVSMMSSPLTGVLSRSVPFLPLGCYTAFRSENECTSQISTNMSDYVSFKPLQFADNYLVEVCRIFGEYLKCIEGDYTYVENNCPSSFLTFADVLIRYYKPACKTYKADQAAFIPCINNNREFRNEVTVCWEGFLENAVVDSIEYITDCRFVDDLIKCFDAFKLCNQPKHFARLMKYVKETRGDVCNIALTLWGIRH